LITEKWEAHCKRRESVSTNLCLMLSRDALVGSSRSSPNQPKELYSSPIRDQTLLEKLPYEERREKLPYEERRDRPIPIESVSNLRKWSISFPRLLDKRRNLFRVRLKSCSEICIETCLITFICIETCLITFIYTRGVEQEQVNKQGNWQVVEIKQQPLGSTYYSFSEGVLSSLANGSSIGTRSTVNSVLTESSGKKGSRNRTIARSLVVLRRRCFLSF